MSDPNTDRGAPSLEEAVAHFVEATGASVQQAQFCIEACGGNVDRALNLFASSEGTQQTRITQGN